MRSFQQPSSRGLACGSLAVAAFGACMAGSAAAAPAKTTASPPAPPIVGETIEMGTRSFPKATASKTQPCFEVDRIVVRGIELLPADSVRDAVRAKALRCIGNDGARAIVAAVNEAHASRGFVATQGYVPQQDLKTSRTFTVNVVTGRVGKIVYRETDADPTVAQAWADLRATTGLWTGVKRLSALADTIDNTADRFQLLPPDLVGGLKAWLAMPLDTGDAVQIDRVQQGLDQLNRSPSQKASAKLEAGEAPGTSNIVVAVPRQDSFRVFAGYEINGTNINGNGTTSARRARLDVYKDNLIGLNDSWAATYAGGLDTNEVSASFAIPVRWLTLSLDGGYSEYLTTLSPSAELFTQLYRASANASYLVSRDKDQQTSVQAGLNWRHLARYINGSELTPQTIPYLRLGATHQRFFDDKQVVLSLGVSQGLKVLDATNDQPKPGPGVPRAQFLKFDGSASYVQIVKGWGLLRADMGGQWSDHPLYAEDQLILGSVGTVRGFTRSPFRADRGAYIRGEFATGIPVDALLGKHKSDLVFVDEIASAVQLYAFTTFGTGRDLANKLDVSRGSVGGGVRYKHGRINADLTVAQPVYQDGIPKNRDTYKPEIYLVMSTQLF